MTLSDKRTYAFNGNFGEMSNYCYPEEDVKEAIKELKRNHCMCFIHKEIENYKCSFCYNLKRIMGENLI
jgi:hypothetical protein